MKEQILKLRSEGKSYRDIEQLIGCSKGTIAFHCGTGQKLKYYQNRQRARTTFRTQIKQEAGGKCSICHYDKCLDALEFHHTSDDKEGIVSRLLNLKGFEAARQEAKKCILVCANCHREIHSKER